MSLNKLFISTILIFSFGSCKSSSDNSTTVKNETAEILKEKRIVEFNKNFLGCFDVEPLDNANTLKADIICVKERNQSRSGNWVIILKTDTDKELPADYSTIQPCDDCSSYNLVTLNSQYYFKKNEQNMELEIKTMFGNGRWKLVRNGNEKSEEEKLVINFNQQFNNTCFKAVEDRYMSGIKIEKVCFEDTLNTTTGRWELKIYSNGDQVNAFNADVTEQIPLNSGASIFNLSFKNGMASIDGIDTKFILQIKIQEVKGIWKLIKIQP